MTDFKLSCCRLFEQNPLYNYRSSSPDSNRSKLYVLLIGYGSRMDTILREVLTNGQLLDTDLDVTIANTNAPGTCDALMKKAPYLRNFASIICDMKAVSSPAPEESLCTLRFDTVQLTAKAMEDVLLERCECSYIIISTGNDEKNFALAKACSEFIADHKTLIAYVQKKETDKIEVMSPMSEVYSFGAEKLTEYQRQIEQIALNLHYAYAKSNNERKSIDQIISEFQEPYNYISNIEAAVHIRSKLACCGITDESLETAAEKFAHLISSHPEVVEQLSVLEHSRWMMEKLLQGYRQIDDLDQIYRNGATTHSNTEKWHCCLVSCDRTGKSRLCAEDWDKAAGSHKRELDALDRMSLALHEKCRERSKANIRQVDELLHLLRSSLTSHLNFSQQTLVAEQNMERAIIQMRQQKKSAIPIYQMEWQLLLDLIHKEGGLLAPLLSRTLESLDDELAPLREYISYKDYKHQDRLLVEQIPFALTHKCRPTMLKILAERETDNLFSAWQLEPEKLIFVGMASDLTELLQVRAKADNMTKFLSHSNTSISTTYYICVPEHLAGTKKTERNLFEGWNCELFGVSEWTIATLSAALDKAIDESNADYLDVTGGEPLLTKAVEANVAKINLATFYVRNGKMCNLSGAAELEYPAPIKGITVREMFDISGAVLEESESEKLSDLSLKYRDLWNIAQGAEHWNQFCVLTAKAYKNTSKLTYVFRAPAYTIAPAYRQITTVTAAATALIPALRHMEQLKFIDSISISSELGDQHTISFRILADITVPDALAGFLQRCCNTYYPTNFYSFGTDNGAVTLTLCDLQTKGMLLDDENREEYKRTFEALSQNKLILNYFYDTQSNQFMFQFASEDVLNCIKKSGTILEYYIYYSALLDAHFTDVDMGYKFLHSASKGAAENEIDVVCTKGSSSLFISAKMVHAKQLTTNNKLNYVLYEISFLAERFGINAKPVLAAPFLAQFSTDPLTGKRTYSSSVNLALSRGVYLLGRECFQDGAMGKVLDNIMDGCENWCDFL